MKRKMRKYVVVLLGVVFTLFGIAVIALNFYRIQISNEFMEKAVPVEGEIVDISHTSSGTDSDTYDYYASYEFNGKEYKHVKLSVGQTNLYVGREMILLIDPDNPVNVNTEENILLERKILFGIGGFALVLGMGILISTFLRKLKHKKLLENGKHIYATVDSIELDMQRTYMDRHPYVVNCSYEDISTKEKYFFKSHPVTFNPSEFYRPGDKIDVYVDQYNKDKYYVEVRDKTEDGFM